MSGFHLAPQQRVMLARMAAAYAGVGVLLILVFGCPWHFVLWLRSCSWEQVPCRVVDAYEDHIRMCAFPRVKYQYQYDGREYLGSRWRTGSDGYWPHARDASAFTERLRHLGTCYVNPRDPSESVLERIFPGREVLVSAFMALFFLVPGIAALVWALRARQRESEDG